MILLIPMSFFNSLDLTFFRGLLSMSASCLYVLQCPSSSFPLITWSIKKWYLISMCLLQPWYTGWLTRLIVDLLSTNNFSFLDSIILNSSSNIPIHATWHATYDATMYSTSHDDKATMFASLSSLNWSAFDHEFVECNTLLFVVISIEIWISVAIYLCICVGLLLPWHHHIWSITPFMYLNTLLTTVRWHSWGFSMNLLKNPTLWQIFGLVLQRYLKDPMICLYNVALINLSLVFFFNYAPIFNGIEVASQFLILYLFKISWAYFFRCRNTHSPMFLNFIPKKYNKFLRSDISNSYINFDMTLLISASSAHVIDESSTYMHKVRDLITWVWGKTVHQILVA